MNNLGEGLMLREEDTAYWARGFMIIWPHFPKICRNCGGSFQRSELRKIFCSDECSKIYRRNYENEYHRNYKKNKQFDESVD